MHTATRRVPAFDVVKPAPTSADPVIKYLLERNERAIRIRLDGLRDVDALAEEGVRNANGAWYNPYWATSTLLMLDAVGQLVVAFTPLGQAASAAKAAKLAKLSARQRALIEVLEAIAADVLVALGSPDPVKGLVYAARKAVGTQDQQARLAIAAARVVEAQEKARASRSAADVYKLGQESLKLMKALAEVAAATHGELLGGALKEQAAALGAAGTILDAIRKAAEAYEVVASRREFVALVQARRKGVGAQLRLQIDRLLAERERLLSSAARASLLPG